MGEAPGVLLRDVSNIPAQEVNNNDDTEASSETGAPPTSAMSAKVQMIVKASVI